MSLAWAINGLLLGVGALAVAIVGRFAVALANDEPARDAVMLTRRWTMGIVGSAFTVGALGLVEAADILAMLGGFIGAHPFAVSNGLTATIGALGLAGILDISPEQFVGLAIAGLGIVLVLYEVDD